MTRKAFDKIAAGLNEAIAIARVDNASSEHVHAGHLRAFIERIEKLEEEKHALADDIKEIYGEAKGTGFDVKIIRKIVAIRKQDRDQRREEEEILGLYLSALGIE